MISYPIRLIPADQGKVLVTFPAVPEAVSCGEGEEAAIEQAGEVLEIILGCYESGDRAIPEPSDMRGAPRVTTHRFSR